MKTTPAPTDHPSSGVRLCQPSPLTLFAMETLGLSPADAIALSAAGSADAARMASLGGGL
jgi:hypothetical protein